MATFTIYPQTPVSKLKSDFREAFGGVLRVYSGRSEAADNTNLVSMGVQAGSVTCDGSKTVGALEAAFQNELNLKVKVYTNDNWVKVLDEIQLAKVNSIPNGSTRAKMEEFIEDMVTFSIDADTTVEAFKAAFVEEYGGNLRVYNGRSEAELDATLVSLGAAEGELSVPVAATVGDFEEGCKSQLELKVKVYTNDNWVKVLDGIALTKVGGIPNGSTKAKMEEFLD